MIQYYQAVILGLLQGFSELFPISSLGHSVVLPKVLGWNIQQTDKFFLNFLVATHLATALVLLGFFRRDWVRIVKGLARSLRDREIKDHDHDARLGWLLVVGTIPAGLLVGLSNEDAARYSFLLATPIIGAAAVLKLPELAGKSGHVIGTAVVGAACAAVTAYLSVKFLLRYFETNTLTPFAIYCVAAGTLLTIGFALSLTRRSARRAGLPSRADTGDHIDTMAK